MDSSLNLAFQITAIGMGLVFAAIIMLWAVMAAIVRFTSEKDPEEARAIISGGQMSGATELEQRRLAAAAAVIAALATMSDHSEPHPFPLPPTAIVSAWQAVLRTRMITKRGFRR